MRANSNLKSCLNRIALTPPMGWNSFDCYGSAVTENEVRSNAIYMAKHLKKYGWKYIVIDYCWSHPNPGAVDNPHLKEEPDGREFPVHSISAASYARINPAERRECVVKSL